MILLTNPGVIEAYNARKKQIAEIEKDMEKNQEKLVEMRASINEIEVLFFNFSHFLKKS